MKHKFRTLGDKMDSLESALGHLGSIEMLSELDAMLSLPQPEDWKEAIKVKRDRVQNQLQEWGAIVRKQKGMS